MKRAFALAILLVVALASPAAAHVRADPRTLELKAIQMYDNGDVDTSTTTAVAENGDSGTPATSSDGGEGGTDLATFAALAIGGMALVAALTALIMGRGRIPS